MTKTLHSGIATALYNFAYDHHTGEGVDSAIAKAEKWRDTLEEILEICNEEQVIFCDHLLQIVRRSIANIIHRPPLTPDAR